MRGAGLIVREFEAVNFRNIKKATLTFSPTFNLIAGDNAQGKTNLLEALHFFSLGRSFRTRRLDEAIMFGEEYAFLRLCGRSDSGIDFKLEAGMERGSGVRASVNGKKLSGMSEVIGIVPTVLFTAGDVTLASGAPAKRRVYLDYTVAQISPAFLKNLKGYRRVVRSRNALLKRSLETGREAKEIEAWNEGFIEKGAALVRDREEMARVIADEAAVLFGKLLPRGERLRIEYICSFVRASMSAQDSLREALRETRAAERRRGYTLVGPHYDDLALYIDDVGLRRYGSQGRKRLVAIVLKLTQAAIIMTRRSERPAVLLDDIFSELDHGTTRRVRELMSDTYQSFITSPRAEELPRETVNAKHFVVARGEITPTEALP